MLTLKMEFINTELTHESTPFYNYTIVGRKPDILKGLQELKEEMKCNNKRDREIVIHLLEYITQLVKNNHRLDGLINTDGIGIRYKLE